jgi:transcriptional repressor NF-X1
MSHNRRGRPRGRPTEEWTEYVPKGKDPGDSHAENDHESRAIDPDRQRPTEDKADQQFNKKPYKTSDGHTGSQRRPNDRPRREERRSDSREYAVKDYTRNRGQRTSQKQDYRNSDMLPYQKKGLRGGRDQHDEYGDELERDSMHKQAFQWRECVICLLKCSPSSTVWNCNECRITCHLKCIRDWICKQNNIEKYDPRVVDRSKHYLWTCPHCQTPLKGTIPSYYCFCSKSKNPKQDMFLEPHSCELLCQKKKGALCIHPCTEPCHSGFCPPCSIVIPNEPCFCGKEVRDRECGELNKKACNAPCNKLVNCKLHICDKVCHEGDCPPCPIKVQGTCHCGKRTETRRCGEEFSCDEICNRQLDCEVHRCG